MSGDALRYSLEVHQTVTPKPVAIWEMRDSHMVCCVADLRGWAAPTLAEAEAMVAALNALDDRPHAT